MMLRDEVLETFVRDLMATACQGCRAKGTPQNLDETLSKAHKVLELPQVQPAVMRLKKRLQSEPRVVAGLRASIRSMVTILLTLAFLAMVGYGISSGKANWSAMFTTFLAVYGPILGFWFGEHSALKVPGGKSEEQRSGTGKEVLSN